MKKRRNNCLPFRNNRPLESLHWSIRAEFSIINTTVQKISKMQRSWVVTVQHLNNHVSSVAVITVLLPHTLVYSEALCLFLVYW